MVDEQALKGIKVSKAEELKILGNLSTKTKQGNKLQYFISYTAALLLMGILGYSYLNDLTGDSQDINNQPSTVNATLGTEASVGENVFDTKPSNEDVTVTFSVTEQDLIKNMDGIKSLILSSNAFIPLETINNLAVIKSEPKVEATKTSDGVILVKATFPIDEGDPIILMTKENKYGSVQDAIESISSVISNSKPLSISGRDAILYETNGNSEVLIIEEKIVYSISGGNDSSVLSSIAEQIVFSGINN